MRIKYLTSYQGPSYGSVYQELMDGEQSLYSAMVSFRRRIVMGYDDVSTYKENPEGTYVIWETDRRVGFPGTTEEDYMDLYYAIPTDGGYTMGDWAYRISLGPRKGVRSEKA